MPPPGEAGFAKINVLCRNVKMHHEEEVSLTLLETAVNDYLEALTEEVVWDIDYGITGSTFWAIVTYIEA